MNRQLTLQEKRTIRIAAVCVCAYLALFHGLAVRNYFMARREAYNRLVQQARDLRDVIQPYEEKISTVTNLMVGFPHGSGKAQTFLGVWREASAAIQQAAASGGVAIGPIRETQGRASAREAGSIQFEGSGPIPAVMDLLDHLNHIGFPVIVETVQLGSDPRMPNSIKVNLTIVVLDFDAWKAKGGEVPCLTASNAP